MVQGYVASWEHFLLFGDLKMLSLLIGETHGSRISCFMWRHFLYFGGLKTDMFRVMKLTVPKGVRLFNCISSLFYKPVVVGIPIVLIEVQSSKVMRKDQIRDQGQRSKVKVKHKRQRPPNLKWATWKRDLPFHETHISRGPVARFLHFGGLKMRFLPSRGTHGSRLLSFVWANCLQLRGLKMWILPIRETHF